MTTSASPPPTSILLATDLSARGDRALARALQLARQWKARLVVATVLPDNNATELLAQLLPAAPPLDENLTRPVAEQRLRRLFEGEVTDVAVDVRVGQGHVGRAILQLAAEEDCGLIITGIASDPLFELPMVGSSVLWLTRHSTLPVLIVHDRVRGPYRNLALASDFSDSAEQAARCALDLFGPPLQLSLVHALESPGSVLLTGDREALQEQERSGAREQAQALLAGLRPLLGQAHVSKLIEPGDPARMLTEHARAADMELVIVATHGRSALFDLLIGSVARRLVETLETDTLLVRDPRSLAAANADAAASV
ncbi:universal stress protein [Stenotrophomonas sp. SY1]|uniref:universal stress protein n=1 Tax=Stenotrophomonas sp. SY1 TaxID=477235 RepID=UPI001E4273ED|nr:universal stress protein [Stenotrophomonas sp. SY1]MCD9088378.1 universal stress protein [Stenotrophomonas sp. SY1]